MLYSEIIAVCSHIHHFQRSGRAMTFRNRPCIGASIRSLSVCSILHGPSVLVSSKHKRTWQGFSHLLWRSAHFRALRHVRVHTVPAVAVLSLTADKAAVFVHPTGHTSRHDTRRICARADRQRYIPQCVVTLSPTPKPEDHPCRPSATVNLGHACTASCRTAVLG
jgi:hypothetical protein